MATVYKRIRTLRTMTTPLLVVVMFLGAMVQVAEAEPDMQVVRQRLVEMYVMMDLKVEGTAEQHCQSQRDDGSWDNINYEDTNPAKWDAYNQVGQAMLMAQAFRASGGKEEILAVGARKALAWWSRWELRNSNWWWNQIGIPQATGITCLEPGRFDIGRRPCYIELDSVTSDVILCCKGRDARPDDTIPNPCMCNSADSTARYNAGCGKSRHPQRTAPCDCQHGC